ncbi:hypothetical protein [uncultured Pseudodesulfovibrio sp.]|uniref:hypothetical protein n=1 Tax=uncultured Pseudodesulfovibrio sp. TaxID=2035858 RepID=UPI0029C6CCCB|nr:hypothetical protein [uncultured Pseudodesulfovibrio sp.]
MTRHEQDISPDMVLLDIVRRFPETEAVFHAWGERAGECLLCQALFDTVEQVSLRYGLDLERVMKDLRRANG